MTFNISEFIYFYFGRTIAEDLGYNLVNTSVYAIFALLIFFFILKPFVSKYYGKLDNKFVLFSVLIIIFGSMLRVSEEFYSNIHWITRSINPLDLGFWFITPGIYLMILFIALYIILISWYLEKKLNINQKKSIIIVPLILNLIVFLIELFYMTHFFRFILTILLIFLVFFIIYFICFKFKIKLIIYERFAILAQIIDGFATYSALKMPYFMEQHVFSNFLMQKFGLISFPIFKIFLVLLIIFVLRKSNLNQNVKNYILLFIILFGFATGVRNLFSIALVMM